ncbi:MAG: isoaspartyl peptidase/L-asparaginase family protein [Propionibacteriaceae bacterium]
MPIAKIVEIPVDPADGFSLMVHGGAGARIREFTATEQAEYAAGLSYAYEQGAAVLRSGGSALDAVSAAVVALEDCPLFNAGTGATLTESGSVEHDACVCTDDGKAGAVTISRHALNPITVARAIMDKSKHVLLGDPSDAVIAQLCDVALVDNAQFITPTRIEQLAKVQAQLMTEPKHGTVGAVARDKSGHLAAATSTGGHSNKMVGRIGDTPIVGAGTFCRPTLAISGTGDGEGFILGCLCHDVYARMEYGKESLRDAASHAIETELDSRSMTGGVIAIDANGTMLAALNSDMMFTAYQANGELITWV